MQIREGNSRYPENLAERFIIQEDTARRYEPTEDRTVVLNFSEFWNRSAERKESKRFSPFKNSLSEQYSHISYELTKTRELVTFIWSALYRMRTKTERTLYFSHPSFIKSPADRDDVHDINISNVAIRMPLRKQDLVLMGDIRTVHEKTFVRKEYVVKGISLLNSSPHAGETRVDCAVICRVINTSIPGFYTTKGELAEGYPLNVYNRSVIDGELEESLNRSYVVSDPQKVIAYLNDWKTFQTVESMEAEKNEMEGFAIDRPEFFVAYPLSKNRDIPDENVILETPEARWSDMAVGNVRPRLVAKVVHRVDRSTFLRNRNYLADFNRLAMSGVKVSDPLDILSGKKGMKDADRKLKVLGSERIVPAIAEGLPPAELVQPLLDRKNSDAAEIRTEFRTRITERTEELINGYMRSEEAVSFVDGRMESFAQEIADKVAAEAPEDADARTAELTAEYRNSIEAELRENKRDEMAKAARAELTPLKRKRIEETEKAYDEAVAKLPADSDLCTLTLYFEVPLRPSDSVIDEAAKRNGLFTGKNYRMVYDQTGEQTNRMRLMDTLNSLMKGEVMNPYLASYLFPSRETAKCQTVKIGHYFGNRFNEEQKRAIEEAINSDGLYLIQGPPGTGKTQVIAEITAQEVLRGRKVLITSQNNKAINNAFDRLYRNALIRPVRLMSEGNESEYDLDRIVNTFYNSVSSSLRKQMGVYDVPGFSEKVSSMFSELEKLHEEWYGLREEVEDIIEEIDYDEEDLRAIRQKLDDIERDSQEKESARKLLSELLENLDRFELTTYGGDANEIKNLFRPYAQISSKNRNEAESDFENRVFGPYGYCSRLMAMSEEQAAEQADLMETNSEYVQLCKRMYCAKDEKTRSELSDKIRLLVNEKGIRTEEFLMLEIFGADLPPEIPEIRDRLVRIRAKTHDMIARRLEEMPVSETDEARAGKLRNELGDIEEELEDFRSDEKYRRYVESEERFLSLLQEMFFMLNIEERFSEPEEAYRILGHRVDIVCSQDGDMRSLSSRIIGEVADYLVKDGVSGIDRDAIAAELSNYVNVVGITCTADGQTTMTLEGETVDLDVTTMGIDVVIVDEISKVPFPELLRPILSGKSVIMVGDHRQLPPIYNVKYDRGADPNSEIVKREEKFRELYTTPLFRTLFEQAPEGSKIMLTKQYRMSSQIMNVINRFYGGNLEMGCTDEEKRHRMDIKGPKGTVIGPGNSVVFINCKGSDTRQEGSTSFENALEAKTVSRLVELMEESCHYGKDGRPVEECEGGERLSLGVISPYAAQTRLIRKSTDRFYDRMNKEGRRSAFVTEGEERFMVKSVDDFQGDERDIIILSLVRTGRSAFISDYRRINVAMSRARRLLVLVGDAESLAKEEVTLSEDRKEFVYRDIMDDIRSYGGYLEADDILGGE